MMLYLLLSAISVKVESNNFDCKYFLTENYFQVMIVQIMDVPDNPPSLTLAATHSTRPTSPRTGLQATAVLSPVWWLLQSLLHCSCETVISSVDTNNITWTEPRGR